MHFPFVVEDPAGNLPGREWAQGFLAGTRLARDGWKELFDSERERDLFVIPLMAGEVDPNWPKEPVTPQLEEEMLRSMSTGFLRSYQHFAAARRQGAIAAYDRAAPPPTHFSSDSYVRPNRRSGAMIPALAGVGRNSKSAVEPPATCRCTDEEMASLGRVPRLHAIAGGAVTPVLS